jgi:hypothetical protein
MASFAPRHVMSDPQSRVQLSSSVPAQCRWSMKAAGKELDAEPHAAKFNEADP